MDPASWRVAKDVISEALRRPLSERETFVRAECADPALADELLSMLLVETPPDPAPEAAAESDEAPFDPGTRLGPYIILDRLGRGGMGEVFLGSDPRLQRKVALKCVIRSLAGSGEQRQRILHEARAAARVNHPNVATIHDIVEVADRAFIVMEYVEGESLAARLKRARLPIATIIDVGRQLGSALSAAHAKGVVHRDLKPANVQLTPEGRAKVLDFGIANAPRLTAPSSSITGATQTGVGTTIRAGQPGTPPYMSPEQLLGRTVDERSDIFSLGVVLFEMTTGRRPFPGDQPLAIIVEQAHGAPRADAINPQAPRALADIIAKALSINADDRYASAADIVTALDAVGRQLERRSEPVRVKIARALVAAALGASAVAGIGAIVIAGFNNTFGRTGEFARFGAEPWPDYFVWGAKAAFPSLFIMTLAAAALFAARLAWRLIEAFGAVNRMARRARRSAHAAWAAAGLDQPTLQAQALAALGIASVVAILWYFRDLVLGMTSLFNSSPIEQLVGMQPYGRHYYETTLDVLMLLFGYGFVALWRRRRAAGTRDGRAATAVVAAVLVVMVLISKWPYRTLNHRDFPRTTVNGERCYVTGRTGDEYLLLCPNASPPRNRAVPQTAVTHLDGVENVFNGIRR